MAITHSVTYTYTWGGTQTRKAVDISADGDDNRIISVPSPSTNLLVALVIDISQLKAFFMVADAALTVKTNSSGAPQETFTLVADQPIIWTSVSGVAIPFAGDVTALYVTQAGSLSTATLEIHILVDATV